MEKIQLAPFNEILAAVAIPSLSDEGFHAFVKDPKEFICTLTELDIDLSISFHAVMNSNNEVHLALPYYSGVEEMQAKMMSDSQFDNVSGGEIIVGLSFFTVWALIPIVGTKVAITAATIASVATTLTIGGIVLGTAAVHNDSQGKDILGKDK